MLVFLTEQLIPRNIRVNLTRLRLSSLNLNIETGRHGSNRVPRPERKCPCCHSDVTEDEFHFVIQCEAYTEIRNTYIKPYFYKRQSVYKFVELLNCNKISTIVKLCNVITKALLIRNEYVLTILLYVQFATK